MHVKQPTDPVDRLYAELYDVDPHVMLRSGNAQTSCSVNVFGSMTSSSSSSPLDEAFLIDHQQQLMKKVLRPDKNSIILGFVEYEQHVEEKVNRYRLDILGAENPL